MIIINLDSIDESLIEKSKKNNNSKGYVIGSVLKERRKEANKTLGDVSKDICCMGFLSKLERNKIDTIQDNSIVSKLCERLELNYEDVITSKVSDDLIEAMNDFAYYRYDNIKKKFEKTNLDLFVAQSAIIQALYYLISEQYNNLDDIIKRLDSVKHTLNSFELGSLILVMIFYYIRTFQYEQALKYLNLERKLQIENIGINILEKEARFLISAEIERKSVSNDYTNIKAYYETGYSLIKQFQLRLEYLKTIDPNDAYKIICSLEKEKLSACVNQFYYTKCYILIKLKMFKETCDLIIEKKLNTCNFIALFSYSVSELFKDNQINFKEKNNYKDILFKLIREVKYLNEDSIHLAFIKLMEYEIDGSTSPVICNYIKEQMLPALDKFQNELYYEYTVKRFYTLTGELFRYKDAYFLLTRILKKDIIF